MGLCGLPAAGAVDFEHNRPLNHGLNQLLLGIWKQNKKGPCLKLLYLVIVKSELLFLGRMAEAEKGGQTVFCSTQSSITERSHAAMGVRACLDAKFQR